MFRSAVHTFSILALLCNLSAGAQQRDPAAGNHAQAAVRLHQRGDLAGAVEEYRASLSLAPNQPELLSNLGAALAQEGHYGEAIEAYRKALVLNMQLELTRLNLALAYYKTGRFADAIPELSLYRKPHPSDLRSGVLLADCYLQIGKTSDAIGVAEPLESLHPDDLALAYVLGTAYIRHGQDREGGQLIDRIMTQGDSAEVHMMLGDGYLRARDFAHAKEEFALAVGLNPSLPFAHLRLGESQLLSGDPDGSLANFKQEEQISPFNFETNFYLGYLYRRRGDFAKAEKYLVAASEIRPDAFGPTLQLALINVSKGDYREARTRLELAIKQDPDQSEAHVLLGRVYQRFNLRSESKKQQEIVRQLAYKQQKESIEAREKASEDLTPLPGPER